MHYAQRALKSSSNERTMRKTLGTVYRIVVRSELSERYAVAFEGMEMSDTRGHRRPHRLAHQGAADRNPLPGDTANRRQPLAARHTGTGPEYALDTRLPGRHSWRSDSRGPRCDLRRARPRYSQGPLRLLPRPPSNRRGLSVCTSELRRERRAPFVVSAYAGAFQERTASACKGHPRENSTPRPLTGRRSRLCGSRSALESPA